VTDPSSQDLHPSTGARFCFDRIESEPEPAYDVVIFLPEAKRWSGTLRWIDGRAELEPALAAEEFAWAYAEALKLARVLHRDPKQHMLRWRSN
jgi:hypothetical protein